MKIHPMLTGMLLILALLPHQAGGQTAILSYPNLSKEKRDYFLAEWKKDSLETERFLDAYTEACSRAQPDTSRAGSVYFKSKAALRLRPMRERLDSGWNSMFRNLSADFPQGGNSTEVIRQAFELSRELEKVTTDEYPFSNSDYVAISRVYYNFNDSARLASTLEKVLSRPAAAFADASRMQAGIMMGRYMTALGHREQAVAFLLGALECEDRVPGRKVYNAIALANLGVSNVRFNRYDATLPLLEKALPTLKEAKIYGLIEEVYMASCIIYMYEDNREKAIEMYDSLSCYQGKAETGDPLFFYDYEKFKLRYTHYTKGAISYSRAGLALLALEIRNHLYHPINLMNVAEEAYNQDIALKASELAALRSRQYAIFAVALILLAAFLVILRLYRKKRAAYRELVLKNRQWAESESTDVTGTKACKEATKKDIELSGRIHTMMADGLYRDNSLTLESLARLLGVNRETVSRCINHTTGKNFPRFLNEYRIKEAIRLLSAARNQTVNLDDLCEQVGFNNRNTFHRVFKQITGLPPNEFKNNS